MDYAYNKELKDNMVKAYGRALGISTKTSVEICRNIRGKNLQKAKAFLTRVINKESAVVMKRYNMDTAHKPGIGAGKYPIKAVTEILYLLKSAESNALNKGLNTNSLIIEHLSAHKASTVWHYGRQKRSKMKRTHIHVVLAEVKEQKKDSKKESQEAKKPKENKEIKE